MNAPSDAEARVRLRADAYWAPVRDGCHVLTHDGSTEITGRGVADWLDRLAPALDGTRSVSQIVAPLAPERRQYVERLVRALADRGIVQVGDPAGGDVASADASLLDTYRAEVAMLAGAGGGRAFRRWRASAVGLRWAGAEAAPVAQAVLRALLRAGAASLLVTGPVPPALVDAARRDPEQRVWPAPSDAAAQLRRCDLVVHVASDDAAVAELDRASALTGVAVLQVLLTGDGAWLTDPLCVGLDGPGLSDARRRAYALAAAPAPGGAGLGAAVLATVAGRVAHAVLRRSAEPPATPAEPPDRGRARLVRLGRRCGESSEARVLAHPFGPAVAPVALTEASERVAHLAAARELDTEVLSQRAAACVDAVTGLVGEIGEGELVQLPLHVSRVVVSDPVGLLGSAASLPAVFGVARELAAARQDAALRALATYSSLVVDPRLVRDRGGLRWWPADGDPAEGLRRLRAAPGSAVVPGVRLADGADCALPVAVVHPAVRWAPTGVYRAPPGTAAGPSWSAALSDGLLQHCLRISLDAAASGATGPLARVGLGCLAADPDVGYALAMLRAGGAEVAVHDATGPLDVPAAISVVDGRPVGCAAAATPAAAVRGALEVAVLAAQSRWARQPEYAPPPLHLPRGGFDQRVTDLPDRPLLGVPDLVERLERAGRRAVAVPLDHDPQLRERLPFVVEVVAVPRA